MAGAFWTLTVAILCSLSHVLLCGHSPQFGHQLQDQFLGSVTTPSLLLDDAGPHPLLLALLSERVPTSTVRAMMTNYLTGLDLGHSQTLAAVRMANHRRHQLAQTFMFLRMLQDEMTETIRDIQAKDRVYTFQVEGWGCNCSLYYRDERGQMQGFFVDVVLEVCKEAGKICKVQEHPFADCMSSNKDGDQIGGKGLLGRQFDACFLSPGKSVEHIVSMIDSVVEYTGNARFYVKKENVDKFDPTDVTGKKIVFYNGWHSTPRCLKKHNVVGADGISFQPMILRRRDVPFFVEKNEVDAIFALELSVRDDEGGHLELAGGSPAGFVPVGETMYCTEGIGLAARKDNDVTKWFNETLRRMKRNGKFAALCKESGIRHGRMGPIGCKY